MVIFKKAIPRRTFLRGAGATLALPMLDSMTPAFGAPTTRPIRMAFMQTPNGIFNLNSEWTPKAVGAGWELTRTLEPLAAFKDRMMVISGLDNQQAAGLNGEVGGDHPRACTAWLTGTHAKMTSGADLRAGISADQIAAKEFGKHTQLASLEIGLETPEVVGACESAYGCAYYNTISWRNDTTPLPMENRPRAIFERLFGDAGTDPKVRLALREEDRSILDAINADVKRLRLKVGGTDRAQDRPVSGGYPRRRAAHATGGEAEPPGHLLRSPRRRPGGLLRLLQVDGRPHGSGLADRPDARHHVPDGT